MSHGMNWERTTLGDVVDLLTGFPFRSEGYTEAADSIALVRGDNIVQGLMRWDGVKKWPLSERGQYGLYELKEGDVVLAMDRPWIEAGLKYAAISKHDLPCLLVQRTARLRGGPRLDTRFLRYLIGSREFTQHIQAVTTGTAVPHISSRQIKDFSFAIPPVGEQRVIAGVLGALDDKIELNRRMNATLEAMARALFQSWFVVFDPVRAKLDGRRLPGLDPATADLFPDSFQDSSLGEIPAGWSVTTLKSVTSKIGSGATPRGGSSVYVENGIAFIRSQNVHDHEFRWEGLARLSDHSAIELKNVEVRVGDVLLNITGDSILRTCLVDPSVLPARVNQHVVIIRAAPPMPARFLHLYMVQSRVKDFLLGLNAGATRPAVTKGHLEGVSVLLPPAQLLADFDRATAPLFRQIETNRLQSRTLAALRDTLLPELLGGGLRIRTGMPDPRVSVLPKNI